MRPGLSFRDSSAATASGRTMHLVRAAIYGVRGRAVKPANAPDDRLRAAIESRFDTGQGWIASSQALLAMTDDAALPIAKLIPVLGPGRCSIAIPHRPFPPNLAGLRFFCGIFSAFAWQPPVSRKRLCHATAAQKPGSVSCHSSLWAALPRVRRMPAASLQDSPHRG